MNPPSTSRFQFDLATLLWAMGAVGVTSFLLRYTGDFPHVSVLPSLLLIIAWHDARSKKSANRPWAFLAIAGNWFLIETVISLERCFIPILRSPRTDELHYCFNHTLLSYIPLSLYSTVFVAYLAVQCSRGHRSLGRRWVILSPLVGLLNFTFLTFGLYYVIEWGWPYRAY